MGNSRLVSAPCSAAIVIEEGNVANEPEPQLGLLAGLLEIAEIDVARRADGAASGDDAMNLDL